MIENIGVSDDVKKAYDAQYSPAMFAWRDIGAYYKAKHILNLWNSQFKTSPRRILEVGAGEGAILRHLSRSNFGSEYYAVEISESGQEMIRSLQIPQLRSVELFDGYTLAFDDQAFDLIILSHVLEHVEHERLLLREIKRVGKHLSIEVPLDFSWQVDQRVDHYLSYGHINIYTPPLLRFLLKSEGFEILADLPDITGERIQEIVHFEHQKRDRTPEAEEVFRKSNRALHERFHRLPREQQEQEAKDYTVLVRSTDQCLKIF